MKMLITGGSGKIGKKLLALFADKNFKIRLLEQKNSLLKKHKNTEIIIGDLMDCSSLKRACLGTNIILHMAAITHSHDKNEYFKINVEGTKNIVQAAEKNLVKKIVFISSTTVNTDGGAYAYSKLLAENEIKKFSRDWIILRLSEVYGMGEKEAISKLIKIIKNNFFVPIIGKGDYLLSPVYIEDILPAIEKAVTQDNIKKHTFILAGPKKLSYNTIVDNIEKMLLVKRIRIKLPITIIQLLASIFSLLKINVLYKDQVPRLLCQKSYDIEDARKYLDFSPRDFETGLKSLIKINGHASE